MPEESDYMLNARNPNVLMVQISEREPFRYHHRFVAMEKELVKGWKR